MKALRNLALSAIAAIALLGADVRTAHSAAPTGTFWIAAPNELGFIQGGIRGRYLIFEPWDATTDWPINTLLQHGGELYWAETDPAAGDEPGTAAAWTQISGGGGGGGASITAGTADPTGGSAGDAYIQIDASNVVQSLWRNAAGTWTEYTLPTGGGAGDITAVLGTAPIVVTGGDTGDATVTISAATTAAAGSMSAADKTKLDGVAANATANAGDITAVLGTAPIVVTGGASGDATVTIGAATTTARGTMSAADKTKLDGLGPQIELIDSLNDVTYTQADTADLSSRFGGNAAYVADIDAEGTGDATINDLIVFQWRDNPSGVPATRALGVRINQTGTTLPIRIVDPLTNALTNKTVADLTRYEFLFLSRQDGVFIQLAGLELAAAMTRILPASPSDDQIARYDSATSAWVAEDLPAGNIQTFIADTDTPAAYTNAARDFLRVNAATNAVEFVPEPTNNNTIPHVARIPDATADSPLLIILTNEERDGNRDDVTFTVATDSTNAHCGYSDGALYSAFGAISEDSPVASIYGVWNATDSNCDLSNIYSYNEGFIDDITRIVGTAGGNAFTCDLGIAYQEHGYRTKRITSCTALENLATGDITINFLDANGDPYWRDGDVVHSPGLYVKLEVNGALVYHDVTPPEDAHKTGTGSAACGPSQPPTAPGQVCVADGQGYFAKQRTSLITTPATITVGVASDDRFIPDIYRASDLESRPNLNDGNFIYIKESQEFYQFQDPDFVVVTWAQAWQYLIDNVGDTAIRQTFLASTFLGEFASENEVIRDRDGYTDDSVEYYFLYSDFGTLLHITAFTNSAREEIAAGLAWRGPVIISEEVLDIIEGNPSGAIDEPLDSIKIGSRVYSAIVRPGSNGALRAATAADYDTTYARSKVVAVVDGRPFKVRRTLAAGHTASGTFTAVAANTSLTAGGSGTFRFRGIFDRDQDVGSPEEDDIYYNIQYHHWRVRDHDPAYGNYWYTLPNGGEILTRLSWVDYFTSETDALGHATAVGQRFVLPQGNGWALYTLTAFTAAEPQHYEYSWTEAVPVPVLPANETLIDDQELTWASANKPSVEVEIGRGLVEADDSRPILIDYRPNAAGDESRAAGGIILTEHVRHLTTLRPVSLIKVGPGFGGRSAIDRTADVTGSPGSVEFPFPLSSGDNALRWMRLHYIGDHIDDVDGALNFTDTTLTLDSVADIRTGTDYWVVGPVSGAGCGVTTHSEKVTVTAIGDPNPNDVTVVRGVDGTALADANCDQFAPGADFIEDDKATFTMVPSHDDQDSGDFTFTLLAHGGGGGGATPAQPASGGGILLQKHLASSTTSLALTDSWADLITQSITVAGATDRVYVDATIALLAGATPSSCNLRVVRGTDQVGSVVDVDFGFNGEHEHATIRTIDVPGAGTYTYAIQGQEDTGNDICTAQPDNNSSFVTFDVLAANP